MRIKKISKLINKIIIKPSGPFKLKYLAKLAKAHVFGNNDLIIKNVDTICSATKDDLALIDNIKYFTKFHDSNAGAFIVSKINQID